MIPARDEGREDMSIRIPLHLGISPCNAPDEMISVLYLNPKLISGSEAVD